MRAWQAGDGSRKGKQGKAGGQGGVCRRQRPDRTPITGPRQEVTSKAIRETRYLARSCTVLLGTSVDVFKLYLGSGHLEDETLPCKRASPGCAPFREMGVALRNLAPGKHLLVWIVKPSGCHCADGHFTGRYSNIPCDSVVECNGGACARWLTRGPVGQGQRRAAERKSWHPLQVPHGAVHQMEVPSEWCRMSLLLLNAAMPSRAVCVPGLGVTPRASAECRRTHAQMTGVWQESRVFRPLRAMPWTTPRVGLPGERNGHAVC